MDDALRYQCPDETAPVSRAIHLGRLSRFHPACRSCVHRDDVATLSPGLVERIKETTMAAPDELFSADGFCGVYLNQIDAATIGRLAKAVAQWIVVRSPDGPSPALSVACDGRPETATLLADVVEALRRNGCGAIDLAEATTGSLAWSTKQLGAAGGMLLAFVGRQPGMFGVRLVDGAGEVIRAENGLTEIRERFEQNVVRPVRRLAALVRQSVDEQYLERLRPSFHALRPLVLLVDSASSVWLRYWNPLADGAACRLIETSCGGSVDRLAEEVARHAAHFVLAINGFGEITTVVDERGRSWPVEQVDAVARQATEQAKSIDPIGPADGLETTALLLQVLSQSDRPLSEVLAARESRHSECQGKQNETERGTLINANKH